MIISCNEKSKEYHNTNDWSPTITKNIHQRDTFKELIKSGKFVADAGNIGVWTLDSFDLPVFNFTASLPIYTFNKSGDTINDPVDPWFILGNYRLCSFIHASGEYELFSMSRAIARLNYGDEKKKYISSAQITIDGEKHQLTGLESEVATSPNTRKSFGTGYADFQLQISPDVNVHRKFSTLPSETLTDGCSAFLLHIEIENNSDKEIDVTYTESLQARYDMRFWNNPPYISHLCSYLVKTNTTTDNFGLARFIPRESTPVVFADSLDIARADGFPPMIFMQVVKTKNTTSVKAENTDTLTAVLSGTVKTKIEPHKKVKFDYIVGYDQNKTIESCRATSERLLLAENQTKSFFQEKWRKKIPDFKFEKNDSIRLEMQWHTYVLYSMAIWSEIYKEVYIPQGNLYEYEVGVSGCINDFMDHGLPLAYYDKELAKSILRFGLKHVNAHGNSLASDEGGGRKPVDPVKKSHEEIYILMAVSEYLYATGDACFLQEEVPFYGYPFQSKETVLDRLTRCFQYIRDEIYIGKHGLIRALTGDLNDCIYFFFQPTHPKINYFTYFNQAEVPGNTSFAIYYFDKMSKFLTTHINSIPLENRKKALNLAKAMDDYKNVLFNNLIKVWGNKPYLPRLLLGDIVFGQDTMFLESQCYTLGLTDLPVEKRKALWSEVKTRLFDPEKTASRIYDKAITTPIDDGSGNLINDISNLGEHENGGSWNYLHVPTMVSILDIDRNSAQLGLKKILLITHAKLYPNYWVGMWTGPDSYNSSLAGANEGLGCDYTRPFPVYCAHQHAWPLWLYFKINRK